MLFWFILLIITVAFVMSMVILKNQEKNIREDGAKFEEYVYKRDLRANKNNQIAAIVLYVVIMVLLLILRIMFSFA